MIGPDLLVDWRRLLSLCGDDGDDGGVVAVVVWKCRFVNKGKSEKSSINAAGLSFSSRLA